MHIWRAQFDDPCVVYNCTVPIKCMPKPVLIVSLMVTSTVLSYIRGIMTDLQPTALDIVQASQEVHMALKVLKNVRDKVDTYHEK